MDSEIKPLSAYNAAVLGALALATDERMSNLTRQTSGEFLQALLDCYRVDDAGAYLINKELQKCLENSSS